MLLIFLFRSVMGFEKFININLGSLYFVNFQDTYNDYSSTFEQLIIIIFTCNK
jgi:hypothetical protein